MVETRKYSLDINNRKRYGNLANLRKSADMHIHTNLSDGTATPREIVDLAVLAGLHAIGITDHDVFRTSAIAREYAQKNNIPVDVIKGTAELSTADGHLLVYNSQEEVASGLSIEESIKRVHRKKGLVAAAHPGFDHVSAVSLQKIQEIIDSPDPELYFDGIEINNATGKKIERIDRWGILFDKNSLQVSAFLARNVNNPKLGALLGGSDTHTKRIGDSITIFFQESILDAIRNQQTMVFFTNSSFVTDLLDLLRMAYAITKYHTCVKRT